MPSALFEEGSTVEQIDSNSLRIMLPSPKCSLQDGFPVRFCKIFTHIKSRLFWENFLNLSSCIISYFGFIFYNSIRLDLFIPTKPPTEVTLFNIDSAIDSNVGK